MFIISVNEIVGDIQDAQINIEDNFNSLNMQVLCEVSVEYIFPGDINLIDTSILIQTESSGQTTIKYETNPESLTQCDILIEKNGLNIKKNGLVLCVVLNTNYEIGNKMSYLQYDALVSMQQVFSPKYEFYIITSELNIEHIQTSEELQTILSNIECVGELGVNKKIQNLEQGKYIYIPQKNKLMMQIDDESIHLKMDLNFAYDIYLNLLKKLIQILKSMDTLKKKDIEYYKKLKGLLFNE